MPKKCGSPFAKKPATKKSGLPPWKARKFGKVTPKGKGA